MVTSESEQDVADMQRDQEGRLSSLLGGLAVGATGLRRGGIAGAVMTLLGGTLLGRGLRKSSPPEIRDPYAGEKQFVEQQADIAKRQPLATDSPPPPTTVEHRRPRPR